MTPPQRIEPGPGQESVWDYPRPPRIEPSGKHVRVLFNGAVIAETRRALRVLETSGAPVYYIPPEDVARQHLRPTSQTTWCEWKGLAVYYTVGVGDRAAEDAAWAYPEPTPGYEAISGHLAFYPSKMDACLVDGEAARPQSGGYYGGWITGDVVGPFKGEPGTEGW